MPAPKLQPALSESERILECVRERCSLGSTMSEREIFLRTFCCYYGHGLDNLETRGFVETHWANYVKSGELQLFVIRYSMSDIEIPEKMHQPLTKPF